MPSRRRWASSALEFSTSAKMRSGPPLAAPDRPRRVVFGFPAFRFAADRPVAAAFFCLAI
jgi:hypothetical protein